MRDKLVALISGTVMGVVFALLFSFATSQKGSVTEKEVGTNYSDTEIDNLGKTGDTRVSDVNPSQTNGVASNLDVSAHNANRALEQRYSNFIANVPASIIGSSIKRKFQVDSDGEVTLSSELSDMVGLNSSEKEDVERAIEKYATALRKLEVENMKVESIDKFTLRLKFPDIHLAELKLSEELEKDLRRGLGESDARLLGILIGEAIKEYSFNHGSSIPELDVMSLEDGSVKVETSDGKGWHFSDEFIPNVRFQHLIKFLPEV